MLRHRVVNRPRIGTTQADGRKRSGIKPIIDLLETRDLLAAIPIFSTGVAANGQLAVPGAPETHFVLQNSSMGPSQAYVHNPPVPDYVANGPDSQWIGPSADPFSTMASGDFVYRQTFDLSGLDPASAVLNLKLASDNNSRVFLNGVDTNIALIQADDFDLSVYQSLHPFTISTGFVPGVNTLDVVVHNDYSATGLRLDVSGTADPVIPPAVALTSAVPGTTSTVVSGALSSSEPGRTYTVEFFSGPDATPPVTTGAPIGSISVTTDSQDRATFAANLPLALASTGYVFARATATGDEPGGLSAGVPVLGLSDLSVFTLVTGLTPVAGKPYGVTFVVTNKGPSVATGVLLSGLPLDGSEVVGAMGSDGRVAYPSGGVSLTIDRLSPGESATLTAFIRPTHAGMFRVVVSAKSDQGDPNPGDETTIATLLADASPARPDLSVAYVTSTTTPVADADFAVTFTVSNSSQTPASNFQLTVRMPTGIFVGSATGSTGVANFIDGLATLGLPTLGPGESATLTLTVRTAAGSWLFSADATSDLLDARPQDDSTQVVVNVAAAPVALPPGPGPVVVSVRRLGVYRQPTQVVLGFDQPLEPGRAADVGNYQIILAGPDGRFQTADDRYVAVTLAAYEPDSRTVTLIPARKLSLRQAYQVAADGGGPRGITNLRGGALNSGPDGKAGPVYRVVMRGFGPLITRTPGPRRR